MVMEHTVIPPNDGDYVGRGQKGNIYFCSKWEIRLPMLFLFQI